MSDYLERWKLRFEGKDWVPWLILALAAFLRFFLLGIKPPHFDEGINGWFVDQVMKNGFYRYDPTNYHGPLHFYVLLLSESLFGRNLWALRLPVVLVSIGCVWLALKFEPFVGKNVSRIAALAMALSPGFVFYGRYAIHEVWLQFFSMIFILGLLGLWRRGTLTYLWCAGVGLTGMILTKETYAIHVACALLAIPTVAISYALNRVPDAKPAKQTWSWIDLAMIMIVGGFAIVFFYSGTFFNWSGVKGLYLAFKAWTETGAAGHGHEKAWDYWLKLMGPLPDVGGNDSPLQRLRNGRADAFGYELPMLAGLILCAFCQKFKNLNLRYLAIYGVGVLFVYSIIPYKTPWCIISINWPFLFLGAAALVFLWDNLPGFTRYISVVVGLFLFGHLAYKSYGLNFVHYDDPKELYAYVQTYRDYRKFVDPILQKLRLDPSAKRHLHGLILLDSYFPIPWVIDEIPEIGYYSEGPDKWPKDLNADFIAALDSDSSDVENRLTKKYFVETFRLRDGMDPCKAYFKYDTFKEVFPGRQPDFDPSNRPQE